MQVLSSVQSALELVHAYPYLVEPTPLLEALAEQCGQVQTPLQSPLAQEEAAALDAQYDVFRQYVNSVTARDYFEHASMTAVQKLNPVRVLKERQQALLASQMAQHDANQPSGSPFSMVGSHSLQHTRITVPTLDELLLDDSTEGVAGPGSRRGFDHVYNMPQDHKFVRLLGELAGPPKFPSPPDSIAAGVAPAPLTDHAADPLVALGLEMHGRS